MVEVVESVRVISGVSNERSDLTNEGSSDQSE
jgi:hypothetical protein